MSHVEHGGTGENGPRHPLLNDPSFFLPLLVDATGGTSIFYSLDTIGKIVFLSKSSKQILSIEPAEWMDRPIQQLLSKNECNESLRRLGTDQTDPGIANSGICELISADGNFKTGDYTQLKISLNGQVIGYAGVLHFGCGKHRSLLLEKSAAIIARLREGDRKVIEMVCNGHQNKEIASELDVAVRTVESRRSRVMAKLGVKSLAELVKIWTRVNDAGN